MVYENKVELIGTYGDDLTHALAAWTSTARELTDEKKARVGKLLTMLASNGHHTPFERGTLHFLATTDLATHIHLLKHRIGVSCLAEGTQIHCKYSSGAVKKIPIEVLYERYKNGIETKSSNGKTYRRQYGRNIPVRTKNQDNDMFGISHIKHVYFNGIKPVFSFTTESGRKITCTLDHKFFTSQRKWVEIGKLLDIQMSGETATFSNKQCFIGTNGILLNQPNRPWTFADFFEPFAVTHTRLQMAKITGVNYNTIKKWGYIHNIMFADDVRGKKPWNKGRYGYKLNSVIRKRGIKPNPQLGWKMWRAEVGNWTRQQMPKLLVKYNHVCQAQLGSECSRDFRGHHLVPVAVDSSLATDFDNLILVCSSCHKLIHKTIHQTRHFTELKTGKELLQSFRNRRPTKGHALTTNFEKIVGVEYVGEKRVYDLEINNTHNYVANGFVVHNCNSESSRYKELKDDKFYVPQDWDEEEKQKHIEFCENCLKEYHECLERLVKKGFTRQRAKESARFKLPYSNQLTIDLIFNFRSFMHFQGLRNSNHAQREVAWLAKEMLRLVKATGKFDLSIDAFGYKGDPLVKIPDIIEGTPVIDGNTLIAKTSAGKEISLSKTYIEEVLGLFKELST